MSESNWVLRTSGMAPEDLKDCVTLCKGQWEIHLQRWLNDALKSNTMPWPDKERIERTEAIWKAAWMDGFAAATGIFKK